jgi:hypothetical protein
MRFELLGLKDTKMGIEKSVYHYKDSCTRTFQSEITLRTSRLAIFNREFVLKKSRN